MKINTLCDLYHVYLAIDQFYMDSGLFALPNLLPDPTADYFYMSLSNINSTLDIWQSKPGSEGMFKCSIK